MSAKTSASLANMTSNGGSALLADGDAEAKADEKVAEGPASGSGWPISAAADTAAVEKAARRNTSIVRDALRISA